MRKIIIALAVGVSSVSFAAQQKPEIFGKFSLPKEAVTEGLNDLLRINDSALREVTNQFPLFGTTFPEQTQHFFDLVAHSLQEPLNIPSQRPGDSEETAIKNISYAIGKYIKNVSIYAIGEAMESAAPNFQKAADLNYRYCETHTDEHFCAYGARENNNLHWAITRRLMSNAAFIRAVCPAVAPFAAWNLEWNWAVDKDNLIGLFFDKLEQYLTFVYGDGTWSTNRLTSMSTPFDRSLPAFIVRRYLDGGPEFILAAQECLSLVRYGTRTNAPTDVPAETKFEQILKFAPLIPNSSFKFQTAVFDRDTIYRMTHLMNLNDPVPPQVPQSRYSDYVETLEHLSRWNDAAVVRLISFMNEVVRGGHYRTMNSDEFKEAFRLNLLPPGFETILIVEHDSNDNPVYLLGLPTGSVLSRNDRRVRRQGDSTVILVESVNPR